MNGRKLETEFTSDAKSCQPVCDEQISILRPKEQNESLIEHYLRYQPKELVDYIKKFDFQYSNIIHIEVTLLIDMLIDSRDVCIASTNSMLREADKKSRYFATKCGDERASKVPLHLKDNPRSC